MNKVSVECYFRDIITINQLNEAAIRKHYNYAPSLSIDSISINPTSVTIDSNITSLIKDYDPEKAARFKSFVVPTIDLTKSGVGQAVTKIVKAIHKQLEK